MILCFSLLTAGVSGVSFAAINLYNESAPKAAESKDAAATVNEKPILQIAGFEQFPFAMFSRNEQGEDTSTGLLVEKMRLVAAVAGYQIEFTAMPSASRLFNSVQTGKVDGALSVVKEPGRELIYSYVNIPLYNHSVVVLTNQNIYPNKVESLSDLKAGKVGFVKDFHLGDKVSNFLLGLDASQKIGVRFPSQALRLMQKSRIDSFIIDLEISAKDKKAGGKCAGLQLQVTDVDFQPSYIIFHKDAQSPELVKQFESALKKLSKTNAFDRMKQDFWAAHTNDICGSISE